MRVLSYSYRDVAEGQWLFSPVQLKKVNLLVGPTGSGKSRFLNSLFNVGRFVHSGGAFLGGIWDITFEIKGTSYRWQCESGDSSDPSNIKKESLSRIEKNGSEFSIFDRDHQHFTFNGQSLPKLSKTSSALYLLREEELIAPIHRGFGLILRRSFWGPDLKEACSIANLPDELLTQIKGKGKTSDDVKQFLLNLPLGVRLFILREQDREKFSIVVDQFRAVFPSVESVDFKEGAGLIDAPAKGKVPILTAKEKGVAHPIALHELSSGMQKVLLIITDVLTTSEGTVYLIDEYENSLGVNAVNFLPAFLSDFGDKSQFLITSHHPYLINSTPMENWRVFRRKGSNVLIESGEELAAKYGSSKQDAFIQLLNDPDFSGGKL